MTFPPHKSPQLGSYVLSQPSLCVRSFPFRLLNTSIFSLCLFISSFSSSLRFSSSSSRYSVSSIISLQDLFPISSSSANLQRFSLFAPSPYYSFFLQFLFSLLSTMRNHLPSLTLLFTPSPYIFQHFSFSHVPSFISVCPFLLSLVYCLFFFPTFTYLSSLKLLSTPILLMSSFLCFSLSSFLLMHFYYSSSVSHSVPL